MNATTDDDTVGKTYRTLALVGAVTLATIANAGVSRTDPQAIRAAAEHYVSANAAAGAVVHATAGRLDPRLALAPCAGDLTPFLPAGATIRARTLVGVRCAAPQAWTIFVTVDVVSEGPVLVARRTLTRGAPLGPADVEAVVRRLPGLPTQYVSQAADLGGRRLRRAIAAGQALPVDALEDAPVVARGQQLTVVADTPAVAVRAEGVALASAGVGERLRVRNLTSGRVLEGTVRPDGSVVVDP